MGEGAGVTPSCRGYRVSSPKNVENLLMSGTGLV